MADTVIVEGDETPPPEDTGAAGVAAGVALAESADAKESAAEAEAVAEGAEAEAAGAVDAAAEAYRAALEADARSMDTAAKLDAIATLELERARREARASQSEAAKPPEDVKATKAKDEPPADLAKKSKRKTWRERWELG